MTREEWLFRAITLLRKECFKPAGYTVPEKVKASVGFPHRCRKGKGSHAIGQCWSDKNSAGGIHEIFIHPEIDDASRVVDILIHEIAHAVVGIAAGHRKPFGDCARKVGLEGKMTATGASKELKARISGWLKVLGDYPHSRLSSTALSDGVKKQTTRLLKSLCPSCGYTIRITKTWLEQGNPICPCGDEIKPVDGDDDEGEGE